MESTPPLTKKNTLRSPADGADLIFDGVRSGRPDPNPSRSRRRRTRKFERICVPAGRVRDFGMKLDRDTAGASR